MRIAIFGVSGRMGRPLVEQALAAGHEVRALVRDPSKLQIGDERLAVIRGDVLDAAKVEETIAGTDAVLSALGQTKGSTRDVQMRGTENWSPSRGPDRPTPSRRACGRGPAAARTYGRRALVRPTL